MPRTECAGRFVGADALAQPSATKERYGCGTPLAGAVRPPRRQARYTSAIAPLCYFLRRHRNCRSAGILFSVLPEKSMQKRGAGDAK